VLVGVGQTQPVAQRGADLGRTEQSALDQDGHHEPGEPLEVDRGVGVHDGEPIGGARLVPRPQVVGDLLR
jgi:hypothetical protein